jgi:hypothetical protein
MPLLREDRPSTSAPKSGVVRNPLSPFDRAQRLSGLKDEADRRFGGWAGIPVQREDEIPGGKNEQTGDEFVFNGRADPLRLRKFKETGQDAGRSSLWGLGGPGLGLIEGSDSPHAEQMNKGGPLRMAGQIMKDLHGRLANIRPWSVDDPMKKGDEPRFSYQPPGSKTFRGPGPQGPNGEPGDLGDVEDYWKLRDGTVLSTKQINEAGENPIAYGTGHMYSYTPPGASEPILIPPENLAPGAYTYQHKAFPDGTRFALPDGSIPPEMANVLKRQENPGLFNASVRDPRQPWESAAGDTIFERSFWDRVGADDRPVNNPWDFAVNAADNVKDAWIEQSAINEAVPALFDTFAGSIPYIVDRKMRYGTLAALAEGAPYMDGYVGSTAQPTGRFLENFGDIGDTKYIKKDLTKSQQAAGWVAPLAGAALEVASGKAIGGFENFFPEGSKLNKFFGKTGAGKALGSAIVEGPIEEAPIAGLDMAEQDPYEHIGQKQLGVNDKTGEMEYDLTSSRWSTLPGNMTRAAFSGPEALEADYNNRSGGWRSNFQGRPGRAIPSSQPDTPAAPNPKRTQAQLDAELRKLDRRAVGGKEK